MTSEPIVTVVIPAYNVEVYLQECIDSVCDQSHRNLQILVVDDGSSDNSRGVAERAARTDDRVTVIATSNGGVSRARNIGIQNASGQYVTFVDADDWIHPQFVEEMVSAAREFQADVVMGTAVLAHRESARGWSPKGAAKHSWRNSDALAAFISVRMPLGCWNKLFSVPFLKQHNLQFDTRFSMGEGLVFVSRALAVAEQVARIDRPLYWYRRTNPASATTALTLSKMQIALKAIEELERVVPTMDPRVRASLRYQRWMTTFDAAALVYRTSVDDDDLSNQGTWLRTVRQERWRVLATSRPAPRNRLKVVLVSVSPALSMRGLSVWRRNRSAIIRAMEWRPW